MWRKLWFNSPALKERRRGLRNNCTETEKLLWEKLRKSQLGLKFIRQYSIGNYVVDFYCPQKKLAVEIDGEIHIKNKIYDDYRTRWLDATGVKVIRFRNDEVEEDLESIIVKINITLRLPPS